MPRNLPAGLELRSIFVPSNSTHLDMELLVEPGTKGHTLYLTYATDIFSFQTAKAACRALSVTLRLTLRWVRVTRISARNLSTMRSIIS